MSAHNKERRRMSGNGRIEGFQIAPVVPQDATIIIRLKNGHLNVETDLSNIEHRKAMLNRAMYELVKLQVEHNMTTLLSSTVEKKGG